MIEIFSDRELAILSEALRLHREMHPYDPLHHKDGTGEAWEEEISRNKIADAVEFEIANRKEGT